MNERTDGRALLVRPLLSSRAMSAITTCLVDQVYHLDFRFSRRGGGDDLTTIS